MSTPQVTRFRTPTGRIVWGNLYEPKTTDAEGRPLVIKNGPNAGKPRVDYPFGLAIPKAGEQHWAHTPWGKIIYDAAMASWPRGEANAPTFAWKITDGDSPVPNRKGRAPNTREGYPGHWVLAFGSSFAPKILNSNGSQFILEPNAVKPGYYVQVLGDVASNESQQTPGVYLNHSGIALQGYGPEIVQGPDFASVGFGQGPAPAGMSATPVGAMGAAGALPGAAPAAPGVAPAPSTGFVPPPAAVPSVGVPGAAPALPGLPPPPNGAAPAPAAVQPYAGFLGAPGVPVPNITPPPAPPAAPTPPAGPQMTAKANGTTYAAFRSAGWTDQALRDNGYMV
jgi:hypothetical protein